MRICQIVPSLELRHGGPSRSVRQLATALARLGHDVELLSTTTTDPYEKPGRPPEHVFKRGHPRFFCPSAGLRDYLKTQAFDCIHSHGLWLRPLHYARCCSRKTGAKLIISPRGMMSPWAWRHRRARKWLAAQLVHPGAFAGAHGWHATSTDEADDIRRLGWKQPICVAPNGVDAPADETVADAREWWQLVCPFTKHARVALFYSRFHHKKRVLELLDLWARLAPPDWLLLLVGIPEEYSVAALENYIFIHNLQHRVKVFDGANGPPPYAVASLFLLPSHSENFGLVIAEAMAHAVPVLVTDTTPWQPLNQEAIGWCVPWERFGQTLAAVLAEPPEVLAGRGTKARSWVLKHFSWHASARLLAGFCDRLSASQP